MAKFSWRTDRSADPARILVARGCGGRRQPLLFRVGTQRADVGARYPPTWVWSRSRGVG